MLGKQFFPHILAYSSKSVVCLGHVRVALSHGVQDNGSQTLRCLKKTIFIFLEPEKQFFPHILAYSSKRVVCLGHVKVALSHGVQDDGYQTLRCFKKTIFQVLMPGKQFFPHILAYSSESVVCMGHLKVVLSHRLQYNGSQTFRCCIKSIFLLTNPPRGIILTHFTDINLFLIRSTSDRSCKGWI